MTVAEQLEAKGFEEGYEQGYEEALSEIVLNLINMGMSMDLVSQVSDLPIARLEQLLARLD